MTPVVAFSRANREWFWWHVSFFLLAWLLSLLVTAGDLGSVDTARRLQVAHSWWTAEPEVLPSDYPEFGVIGVNGALRAWYGPAQSAVMLPADILVGTGLHAFGVKGTEERKARTFLVSLLVFPIVSAVAVMVASVLLVELRFSVDAASIGAIGLLALTTLLPYTQNNQENSLQLLLTLSAYLGVLLADANPRWLSLSGACCGMNILVRPTTIVDLAAITLFAIVATRVSRRALMLYGTTPLLAALIVDRVYQYHRFGTVMGTYFGEYARQWRITHPGLPIAYPFSGDLIHGIMGALFSLSRSVFLFDPCVMATLLLLSVCWRAVSSRLQVFAATAALLLAGHVIVYGKYFNWAGRAAWGDRFCTTGAQCFGMLALPLLITFAGSVPRAVRYGATVVIALALVVQVASVWFWYNLEEQQCGADESCFVIGRRIRNISVWMSRGAPSGERVWMPNLWPYLAAHAGRDSAARWPKVAVGVEAGTAMALAMWCWRRVRPG